jgi:hypothetical protein
MLGGMSGGGMGFIFDPGKKRRAQERLQEIMTQTKRELQNSLPFAMEPVVYDLPSTKKAPGPTCCMARSALVAAGILRAHHVPPWLRQDARDLPPLHRAEMDKFSRRLPFQARTARHGADAF